MRSLQKALQICCDVSRSGLQQSPSRPPTGILRMAASQEIYLLKAHCHQWGGAMHTVDNHKNMKCEIRCSYAFYSLRRADHRNSCGRHGGPFTQTPHAAHKDRLLPFENNEMDSSHNLYQGVRQPMKEPSAQQVHSAHTPHEFASLTSPEESAPMRLFKKNESEKNHRS